MTTSQKRTGRIAGLALAALLALPGLASAATYYVDCAGGSDAADGLTTGTAWKTITHAAATVPAGPAAATPNVISVAAGTCNTVSGETFPIAFNRPYVSLTGASAGTIINAGGVSALNVDARGFSVSGFTFQSADPAIDISEGGFTVANNTFANTVETGVYFYRIVTDRNTSISFADMAITGNTFQTTIDGIYVDVQVDFDDTVDGLSATFGNFTISGNTFTITTDGDGIDITDLFYVTEMYDGTVTAGNLTVTNNTVTGGDYGINFYSDVDYLDNCQVKVGNTTFSNNILTNQTGYGMYIDYWDITYINYNYYGWSDIALGSLTVSGNTVNSAAGNSSNGIYLSDLAYIYDIYGDSTVTTGPISVTNNTVNVDSYGLYLEFYEIEYLGEEYYDEAVKVTMGATTVTGNTITSRDSYGAYIYYYDMAYDTYGRSAVTLGPFNFSNNTVNAGDYALYYYVSYWGDYMYEDSSLLVNAHTFANNKLTSTGGSAFYFDLDEGAYYMYDNARVDIKAINVLDNTLTSNGGEALYFYFDDLGYEMSGNSVLTMAPITVDNNTISATNDDGIYIYYYEEYIGVYMEDNASATFPNWIITDNTVDATGGNYGFGFENDENPYDNYDNSRAAYGSFLIDGNTFNPNKDAGMDYGIYMEQEYLAYYLYGPVTATFGPITITDNTFSNMGSEAIYINFYDFGYDLTGAPTLSMGDIEIGNNTITGASTGIDLDFDYIYSEEKATVNFGKVNVHDNTLTDISKYGIYAYYYNENYEPDTAVLNIGAPAFNGNTITGDNGGGGIHLDVENSTEGIIFGMPTIAGNSITGFDEGIYLEDLEEASLSCNFLDNNASVGMRFATAGTNFAVHTNSLVGNNVGLLVDDGYAAVINAENNWWGDKAGPVACASCNGVNPGDSGNVDFTPWLTSQPNKNRCGQGFPWIMFTPAITGMGTK